MSEKTLLPALEEVKNPFPTGNQEKLIIPEAIFSGRFNDLTSIMFKTSSD